MIPYDRHQEIVNLLESHHSMSVKSLAKIIHTSEATLRRDLVSLEKQGIVNRVFGGVILVKYSSMNPPLSVRKQDNKLVKSQIAAKAAELVTDGSMLILDASSTVQLMLPHLRKFQKLTIISNSIVNIQKMIELGLDVYAIGGHVSVRDNVALGSYAEYMVSLLHADMLFFSCSGLSLDGELTGFDEAGISYLRKAMPRADKLVFLCDSSKIGKRRPHHLCSIDDVDVVLCDEPLPEELRERIGTNRK